MILELDQPTCERVGAWLNESNAALTPSSTADFVPVECPDDKQSRAAMDEVVAETNERLSSLGLPLVEDEEEEDGINQL